MILTIQYLEHNPEPHWLSAKAAAEKLRMAGDILPITHVLIGWDLPRDVLEACREEASRTNAKFYRWHPLLTGDGVFIPQPEWEAISLSGQRIKGYNDLLEFTFTCPNHPSVEQKVLEHLEEINRKKDYDGFFLDRVRFPSPAHDPASTLGCFCEYCRQKAADQGFDLVEVRRQLQQQLATLEGKKAFVQSLVMKERTGQDEPSLVERFFRFRAASITRLVSLAAERIRNSGFGVALDCFSPSLARMVGQDLSALGSSVEWIKTMTYAHTMGPAGLPYEITGLLDILTVDHGIDEGEALDFLGRTMMLRLPGSRAELQEGGLASLALKAEVVRGVMTSSAPLLAGMELVDLIGVTNLHSEQVAEDLRAILSAGPAGIALSWDLVHISLDKLRLVEKILRSTPIQPLQHC